MIILEVNDYLNLHWLSTILETVFAIFIFLLGVPLLFTHVFMPEEIRELYNKKLKDDNIKRAKKFIIWVFLFVILFANHMVKTMIESCETCITYIWLLIFNLLTLSAFVIYCWQVLKYLNEIIYKKDTFIIQLLQLIREDIIGKAIIPNEAIMDLQTICGVTKTPNSRKAFLLYIEYVITDHLNDKDYKGDELEELLNKVLTEGINENISYHNERDLKRTCEIIDRVIIRYQPHLKEVDCRAAKGYLVEIGALCLKYNKRELFGSFLSSIYNAPNSYDYVRKLCRLSYDAGHRGHVAQKASKYLNLLFKSENENERRGSLRNSIAFFSWLYNDDNNQIKRFVNEKLQIIIRSQKLTSSDFEKVLNSYYRSNDFFSANCISKLRDHFFGERKV